MENTLIFALQVAASLIVCGIAARWYIEPRLATLSPPAALRPLLLFHLLRTMGATVVVPAVVGSPLPAGFAIPGMVGDLIAVALAAAALVALAAEWRHALVLVWVFNIAGTIDFLIAFWQGARLAVPSAYHLGAAWFIPTFFVPAFFVAHLLVYRLLLARAQEYQSSRPLAPLAGRA